MVLVAASDELHLREIHEDLALRYDCETFVEPDVDDELTALAFLAPKRPREIARLPLVLLDPADPRHLREREIKNSLRKEVS